MVSESDNNESLFTPLQHYGPVTSLKIYQDTILCGYGPILRKFRTSDEISLISSQQIFTRNKIHGISTGFNKILVLGGRSFSVIEDEKPIVEKAINEWIITGEFLDENTLVLLTSHNVIYKIDLRTFELMDKIHCNEKSILYSGSIRVGENRTVVSAGTVMDGVIIWDLDTKEIIHTLTDHKGSIFCVKVDKDFKYIASCSDDRTIKLYNFQGDLLSEGWGHGSRIWNLEFFNGTNIISMGEDCTTRMWEYNNTDTLRQLEVIDDCHLGKHVWSGDIDTNHNIAVTGGADGRVRVHDLGILNKDSRTYTIEEIANDAEFTLAKNEAIKSFVELDSSNLVAITTTGKVLIFDEKWSVVVLSDDEIQVLGPKAILKQVPESNSVMISSQNGKILLLQFGKTVEKTWFDNDEFQGSTVTNLLISPGKEFFVMSDIPNPKIPFQVKKFSTDGGVLLVEKFTIDQPQQSRFTATSIKYDPVNNWLIIFSRHVTMMVYDLNEGKAHIFKKLTAGDTITSSTILQSQKGSVEFMITVRDGIYMVGTIKANEDSVTVEINMQNKLSRGFIEGGFFKDGDLILYGFRSTYFYVWNETKQLEITKELCGGSHRFWDLFVGENYKFVYLNKSTITIVRHRERFADYGLIYDGTHGREIRGLALSPETKDGSKLIVTASEDTVVRLGKLFEDGTVKYSWCMNNHISGMQDIKFITNEYLCSSAANEEFFIWKIGQLYDGTPIINQYASLKPSTSIPDLRIMDFAFLSNDKGFLIVTVYSDSQIKVWQFDQQAKSFQLLIDGFYTNCCLLNVNILQRNNKMYILTGATDGHIAIWRIDDLIERKITQLGKPIIKQQLHQSSVKALKVFEEPDHVKVITGGDDNALILSELKFDDIITWELKSFVKDGASATITSISGYGKRIVTTSVDQIVRLWEYEDGLKCLEARYTTVADTGCCDSGDINGCLSIIGGAGLSIWRH